MSTFTNIRTRIRDHQAMYRILTSIPGAIVEPNACIPMKGGGYSIVPFRIRIPNEFINAKSFLSSIFQGGIREFWVFEDTDGTLFINISHDVGAESQIQSVVQQALSQEQSREYRRQQEFSAQERARQQEALQREQRAVEEQRRAEAARQLQLAEEQQKKRVEQERQRTIAAEKQEQMRRAERERIAKAQLEEEKRHKLAEAERAERERAKKQADQEAAGILQQLEQLYQRPAPPTQPAKPNSDGSGADDSPDPRLLLDLQNRITQEYSKQVILDKLEQVKKTHGINLKQIDQLEDGSIKITLRG